MIAGLSSGVFAVAYNLMALFALTIFAGAFLLFQVQPLIAKYILPWFGGGPSVWTTCMLFFQTFLLAGYAYAHAITRYVSQKRQPIVHFVLLAVALFFLPIIPSARWRPESFDNPTWRILLLLTVSLSVPYMTLAATGPLLQAWFSKLYPGKSPYRLYALSNVGSLLALISYPILIEPLVTRHNQSKVWSWSFAVFALLCAACAWRVLKRPPRQQQSTPETSSAMAPVGTVKLLWFLLPACGSVLLLATTNKLCQDVASIPFLWVLPLGLYLLTFIICFDRPQWYLRKAALLALVPVLTAFCYTLYRGNLLSLWLQMIVFGGTLFVCCMICHGEVYRLRPPPAYLTGFYLMIAAGGAAGGVFVAVIAPLIFRSYAELNWGIWILCAIVLLMLLRDKKNGSALPWANPLVPVLSATLILTGGVFLRLSWKDTEEVVQTSRNFYGVLRVREIFAGGPLHAFKLMNGNINHGVQLVAPVMKDLPVSYYGEDSGVGVVMQNFPRKQNRRIGVVGLGIGTLAAYAKAGDTITFYEINPQVEKLAQTQFTYLKDCAGKVDIVMGDARLSLERQVSQQFDILVLDAFSSDAIPTHLLTTEAFEIYFRHLKPDGVIVLHVSNQHLNLFTVVTALAKEFRTMMMYILWQPPSMRSVYADSNWILISRNEPFMTSRAVLQHATIMPEQASAKTLLWSDDYVSLAPILHR